MSGQQLVDAQAVGGVADAVAEQHHAAEAGAVPVPVVLAQPASEPVPEVIGAEVVEPGAPDGGGEHGVTLSSVSTVSPKASAPRW